jgi:hypothetical protein
MKKILAIVCFFAVGFLLGNFYFIHKDAKSSMLVKSEFKIPQIVVLPDVTGKKVSQVQIKASEPGEEFYGMEWTFSRKFSEDDVKTAQLAVSFLERLTGLKYMVDYSNMYWSDDMLTSLGTNNSLLGMTVYHQYREEWRAYIAITSKLKPPSVQDLNAMRDFGSTVIHECLHARSLDIESLVRTKIEKPIDMSFDFHCAITPEKFYSYGLDNPTRLRYSRMIEKIAHESGIQPPWHYSRDYVGERIRPVIQLFMMPPLPGTNSNSVTNR